MRKPIILDPAIPVIAIIVTCIGIITHQLLYNERNPDYKYFHNFDTTNINGMLLKVGFARHGIKIGIKNYRNDFIFFPKYNLHDDVPSFHKVAERGDSIYKLAFSKEIKIIKTDGREYVYNFKIIDK